MKKNLRRFLAIAMALTMVFAMSATAFAGADNAGTASFVIKIYDAEAGISYEVDSTAMTGLTLEAGQTVFDALENELAIYEPDWDDWVDPINQQSTKHLTSFVGYSEANVDHQYNADGSGWSNDWGWRYTVNGVEPTFPNEPNHGMMMNQYTIQPGDEIVLKYVYTESAWDSDFNMIYENIFE